MPREEENIFQAASNKLRQSQPSTPGKPIAKAPSVNKDTIWNDPELDAMMKRLKHMNDTIREAFNSAARQMGKTPEELHQWLEDEKNLLPSERLLLRKLTQELNSQVSMTARDPKKLRKADYEVQQDIRNRRAKTLGSRKNWIPM